MNVSNIQFKHIHLRQMSIDNKRSFEQAYLFNDYWEDIGTIRSFFEANLALTEHVRTNLPKYCS